MLPHADGTAEQLAARLQAVRAQTLSLAAPLSEADAQVQSMPDASPTKWHLAHTSWFFETLVLEAHEPGFRPHHPGYRVLFNSYYNAVGAQHARPDRGLVTRPGLGEVLAYRQAVDERLQALLRRPLPAAALSLLTLGLHHEQQHQELILTDLLHLFSRNPLLPAYRPPAVPPAPGAAAPPAWIALAGGLVDIGHDGSGFAFDNEQPRHRQWLAPYALADRLVTEGEWADFIADGGYREPRWWLSAGWDRVQSGGLEAPAYWQRGEGGRWQVFTLHGLRDLQPATPVANISFLEAEAYAAWAAAQQRRPLRLPTEAEWEHAVAPLAAQARAQGRLLDTGSPLTPRPAPPPAGPPALRQALGDVWAWTRSAYAPYPGFRAWSGAVGEYNGKFMLDQQVLRGGSFATPRSHIRASYRNFFPAAARWQFSGLRLACDAA